MAKPVLIERRLMGICTNKTVGPKIPYAHALYEECYSDGTTKFVRGQTVYTHGHYALPKKGAKHARRPDLASVFEIACIVNEDITRACRNLDDALGKGEYRKKG